MKVTQCLRATIAIVFGLFSILLPVLGQTVWIGTNGVSTSTNWSDTANWSTASSPAGTDVLFGDLGAVGTAGTINSVMDNSSLNPASLTFTNMSQSPSLFFHTVLIPAGVELNNAGTLLVGGTSVPTVTTVANFAGGGTFVQNGTAMNVKWINGSAGGSIATLDLSGLTNFVYNSSGGTITIASSASGSEARGGGVLTLANGSNYITAATIALALGTGNGGTTANAFNLGAGTNIINATTVNIAAGKVNTAVMRFLGATGGLRLRGTGGTDSDRATITLARRGNTGTGTILGSLLLGGHPVDILAGTIILGQYTANQSGPQATTGVFQFDNGIVDAIAINLAICSGNATATANGNLVVGGGLLNVGSISLVNQTLGTAAGTLSITNGGTLNCSGNLVKTTSAGTGTIGINTGSLNVTGSIGSASIPINSLSMSNAAMILAAAASANANVTTLNCGGATNVINITAIPGIAGYPAEFPLIKYAGTLGGTFNIGRGTLPASTPAYAGFISNNTVNGSIDLVVTAGPVPLRSLTWNGNIDGDWNVGGTANWKTNGVVGAVYNEGDFTLFDDSASGTIAVSLTTALAPSSVTVSNVTKAYGLTGGGNLTGPTGLTKQGAGTLYITNSGVNDFTGPITIAAGTIQVGDGNGTGNLGSGAMANNASLIFNRADDVTVSNTISGSGTLTKLGAGVLTVAGANTFTGAATVTSGTLSALNNAALGTTNGGTTVASGATLDFNARNIGLEPVTVSGAGVGGNGALVNNGAQVFPAVAFVTLTGDTVFGGAGRWDLRSATTGNPNQSSLLTSGQPYKLIKVAANQIGIVGSTVDAALGDVEIQGGVFGLEAAVTGLGNAQSNLTVLPGAQLKFFDMTNHLNKKIFLGSDGFTSSLRSDSGANTVVGPVTMTNDCLVTLDTGTSLSLNGPLSGGLLTMSGGGNLVLGGAATHAGTIVNAGTLVLNGNHAAGVTNVAGSVAGNGTNAGFTTVAGYLLPGATNVVGTLTLAGLELQSTAAPVFDLTPSTTIGAGVNDLVVVNGDLIVNGNVILINPVGLLQTGVPYRLLNYTGTLTENAPFFAPNVNGYTFTVSTTTPGQVNLVASGGPPVWNGGSATVDNWSDSANWNGVTILPGDTLYFAGNTRLNNTNDTAPETAYTDLVFNTGAGAFTLNGNSITLAGNIVNNSTATGTVKLGVSFSTPRTFNGAGGTLNVGGGVTNTANATTLALSGNGILANLLASADPNTMTNVLSTTSNANWTLVDNATTAPMTVPWNLQLNAGTFNFGSASSAPTLTSTTVRGVPGDNSLGAVGGTAGTLNISNGILTVTARLNTGTAGNATGIVNVVNGTLNVDDQVQGANGAATAVSFINVSGGTFNIGGTTPATSADPLYVASRGPGTLTMSGTGALNCGILDVSRSINANIPGAVNLNGGTITCSRVGTATANAGAATTGSTATFNFNGGTLKARASSATFIQGSTVAPIIPVVSIVKSGGAIIDSAGFNISVLEPLQHDSSLGATPDGGLTKNGAGTLTLTAASTYTGPTVVGNGTLAVNGSLAASPVTVQNGGTLAGTGTIGSNVTVNAGGTLSPGGSPGVLTVAGNVTLQPGSTNFMELSKSPLANDQVRATAATATTITYDGTLSLVNLAGTLAPGDSFKLFSATNYVGTFNAITPATPGLGLRWNTGALNSSGTISITGVPRPGITSITSDGVTVVVSGTNGLANNPYWVLTSTNVTLPVSSWTPLATNTFDGSGNFSFTNNVDPGTPERYLLLQAP